MTVVGTGAAACVPPGIVPKVSVYVCVFARPRVCETDKAGGHKGCCNPLTDLENPLWCVKTHHQSRAYV